MTPPLPLAHPSVAVTVPVHNGARYVDQALASLAAQTLPVQDVVVVDDGSTDGSAERAEAWAGLLPVRVVRNTRRLGAWLSRDRAVRATGCDLVLQLDADDLLLPHHVALMVDTYRRRPGLVAPRRLGLDEADGTGVPFPYRERLPRPEAQLAQLVVLNYLGIGALFARADYLAVGGYADCRRAGDWDLWIRMAEAGLVIAKPDEPSYVYREHPAAISSSADRRVTDPEILERLLARATDPWLRSVAALSLLQRRGLDHLDGLAPAAEHAGADGRRWRVHEDPDIGTVHVSAPDDGGVRALSAYRAADRALLLTGRLDPAGRLWVREIGPGLSRMGGWPDFGRHFRD